MLTRRRFPRMEGRDGIEEMKWFIELREKFPAPRYNPESMGSWNPGDYIPTWLMKQDDDTLRRLCEKHSLKSRGPRRKLIKRMYLHWRASRLKIRSKGFKYWGYGPGYENVGDPTCSCGSTLAYEKRVRIHVPFPKMRFPRLARFPREDA